MWRWLDPVEHEAGQCWRGTRKGQAPILPATRTWAPSPSSLKRVTKTTEPRGGMCVDCSQAPNVHCVESQRQSAGWWALQTWSPPGGDRGWTHGGDGQFKKKPSSKMSQQECDMWETENKSLQQPQSGHASTRGNVFGLGICTVRGYWENLGGNPRWTWETDGAKTQEVLGKGPA
jgi:hypothetical protein